VGSKALGLLILLIGAGIALSNLGILPQMSLREMVLTYWPVLLIYWGLVSLNRAVRTRSFFWPLTLLIGGALLLLDNLGVLDIMTWAIPAGLILVGLALLTGQRPHHGGVSIIKMIEEDDDLPRGEPLESTGPLRSIKSKVGDLRIGGRDWPLESCEIEQKMGSVRVDLTETVVPEGETVLHVTCKVGDMDVMLPEGLAVWVDATCKIGNLRLFDQVNQGGGSLLHKSSNYEEAERKVKLVLRVKVGDLDVRWA
jgi:lia operon protein LiaF